MLSMFMCMSFCGHMHSFILGIYSRVKFLGHKVASCQIVFWQLARLYHFVFLPEECECFSCSVSLSTHGIICLLKFSHFSGCVVIFSFPLSILELLNLRCFIVNIKINLPGWGMRSDQSDVLIDFLNSNLVFIEGRNLFITSSLPARCVG